MRKTISTQRERQTGAREKRESEKHKSDSAESKNKQRRQRHSRPQGTEPETTTAVALRAGMAQWPEATVVATARRVDRMWAVKHSSLARLLHTAVHLAAFEPGALRVGIIRR